jgi:Mn-containing catalase
MYTVRVDEPDPRFGNMLLEQFGGANGELAAAMQYSVQGLNCEDAARKDLLMDIGTRNSAISRSWAVSPACISSR